MVPCAALRAAVDALDEAAWEEDGFRQRTFRVHAETRSVRLVWTTVAGWPNTTTEALPRWASWAEQVLPVVEVAIGRLGRPCSLANVMLARLDPGGLIPAHTDEGPLFASCHRLHLPLRTHPGVELRVAGLRAPMEEGRLVEINNLWSHSVYNPGPGPRVHLIFDLCPLP